MEVKNIIVNDARLWFATELFAGKTGGCHRSGELDTGSFGGAHVRADIHGHSFDAQQRHQRATRRRLPRQRPQHRSTRPQLQPVEQRQLFHVQQLHADAST